jgi:uncharacterized protein YbjT (DUF2867 family)
VAEVAGSGKNLASLVVVTRLWIVGGERAVAEAVAEAARGRGLEVAVAVEAELPDLQPSDALVDLGLPPRDWPAGEALVAAERARAEILASRGAAGFRVVRRSVLGAAVEARTTIQRAQAAAEIALRERAPSTVALRVGALFGSCGLALAFRVATQRSRLVAVPWIGSAKFEPLGLADFAAYCAEAVTAPRELRDYYDLACGEMLTGALFAQGLAENLGVRRWIVALPRAFVGLAAAWLATDEYPAAAVRHGLECVADGRLLPRRLSAWDDFETRPSDLRSCLAAAAGMNIPMRRSEGKRFPSWKAPEKKGLLGKNVPRRPMR